MSNHKRKDELERKKFIKENPKTMEKFHDVVDKIFGKEHVKDLNEKKKE